MPNDRRVDLNTKVTNTDYQEYRRATAVLYEQYMEILVRESEQRSRSLKIPFVSLFYNVESDTFFLSFMKRA